MDTVRKLGTVLLAKRFHIMCSMLGSYDTMSPSSGLLCYFKCEVAISCTIITHSIPVIVNYTSYFHNDNIVYQPILMGPTLEQLSIATSSKNMLLLKRKIP